MSEEQSTFIVDLALLRREYRERKWFWAADKARDALAGIGVEVRDTIEGQQIKMRGYDRWVKV